MSTKVTFQTVVAATRNGTEEARLVYLDHALTALLVPAETGWFLQLSLGRHEQEGLIFDSLTAAETWILEGSGITV